ncbi:MAG TPA: ABC transporter permease, partial [Mucilaginibacter sp.]|nr:ABC transporter permease [Mucilaginibacter sp.]
MNGYTLHITLYGLAFLVVIITGLNSALLLWFNRKAQGAANRFLALALVVVVVWTALSPFWGRVQLQFPLALGPLIYFYVRKTTRLEYRFSRKDLLHFSPLLVGYWIPAWLGLISVIIYLYLSHRLIADFYRRLRPQLMDRPRFAFRGLDRALFLLGVVSVLLLFNAIFFLAFALVLTGMTVKAVLEPDNDVRLAMPVTDRSDAREKGRRLREAVAANRLYGDAELTLATLAAKLAVHPHDLSRIINVGLEKNFSDFINEFRVREVVRKMQDPAYDRLTLTGIAYESGFNSERTFHRVFKEMTGKTPLEYKNNLKKELPIDKLAPPVRLRPLILHPESPPYWAAGTLKSNIMIKNYFKIAWRNLIKNKSQSFINITGLSIGMAVAMLIGLWSYDEMSFNKYHQHYDRIGQVMIHNGDGTYKALPVPLSQELRTSFGHDFKYVVLSTDEESHIISTGDKSFMQTGRYMQSEAPEMLTLKMISGSRNGLQNPNAILLKQSLANTLFGNADPINKVLKVDNKVNVTVTGVYEDLPNSSEFKAAAFIAPWDLYVASSPPYVKDAVNDWKNNFVSIYVQLNPNGDFNNLSAKIKDLKLEHTDKKKADLYKPELFIHPMSKWHLFSKFENRAIVTSEELKFVWFYGIIGAFVLLLACINFMNLSTARSEKRAKEVGIRKTMGSARIQLIAQFFSESVLMAAFAYLLSIGLIALALPWFNGVAGKTINIPFENAWFWLMGAGFILLTGLLAGCYPALYLSSFNAVNALKGAFRAGRFAAAPRKALVVIQFTASTILIIGTIVVYRQIQFAKNRPVGYSRDGLVTVQMNTPDFQGKYDLIRNELKNTGMVSEVAETGGSLTGLSSETGGIDWPGKDPAMESSFGTVPVTCEFGKTVGWQFIDGRDFSRAFTTDSSGFVINEAAVKYMGLKNPVGKTITWAANGDKAEPYKILGVVKDMVMNSPFEQAYPTVFFLNGGMGAIL